ncbi:MAG TPA: SMI1/KNR4 family protein [Gemmataceae bacterium]|nr:SMI1/KNR4 family protein [Gemmataceae bacterium]
MLRNVVHFLLVSPDGLSEKKGKAWEEEHQALLEPLGAETKDDITTIDTTPAHVAQLLKLLQQWRKEGARVNGYGYGEELVDDERRPVEWFTIEPTGTHYEAFENWWEDLEQPIETLDNYLSVRADRLKPGVHVAGGYLQVYVSERFKTVVEAHRLTGIEFVWIRDIGQYRAMQWYFPVCSKCLGRGLDAPFIDATRLSGKGYQTLDRRGRHGQTSAEAKQYKREAYPADPAVRRLLRLLRSMELLKRPEEFDSVPRFLRKYLPATDFAYTVRDLADYDEDVLHRHRGLAMNRKARAVLKANGLVSDEELRPVLIVERPPPGVENLDRRYGPPPPTFSPEQMARIRELEAEAWAEHVAHPRPPRAPDLTRSLALLRSRKRRAPKGFARPATPKAIAEAAKALGTMIPAAWRKVLRVSNGGRIENCALAAGQAALLIPAEKLAKSRQTEADYYGNIEVKLPDSLLLAMATEIGDSIWLDPARPKPGGDCRVVLMSHETGGERREWSSIAEFLEELLTAEVD